MTWLPNKGKPTGYSYDAQTAAIARKRKLAEALMQAQGPDPNQVAGGMVVKNSPLAILAPLLQQQIGGYMDRRADTDQAAFQAQQNAKLGEWLQNMPGDDPVQPIVPSTGFSTPERQAGFNEAQAASADASRRSKLAWALQGNELGPTGQAIGGRALDGQLFPASGKPFTLKPGEQRFDENGRPVASLPAGTSPEKSPFGTVNPGDFTPESLAKFSKSKNYADLAPVPKTTNDVEQFQALTPQEIAAAGLPAGTSAQKSLKTGKIDVLSRRDNTGVLSQKDATTAKMKLNTVQLARKQLDDIRNAFEGAKDASTGERSGGIKGTLSAGPTWTGQALFPSEGRAKFEKAVDMMRSTLTALTRVPGVGAMSDYETKLDQSKFPNAGEYESVTQQNIDALEDMLALIENGYTGLLSGGDTSQPNQPTQPAAAGPATIQSDAEYEALPSGTEFTGPDGVRRRKP